MLGEVSVMITVTEANGNTHGVELKDSSFETQSITSQKYDCTLQSKLNKGWKVSREFIQQVICTTSPK